METVYLLAVALFIIATVGLVIGIVMTIFREICAAAVAHVIANHTDFVTGERSKRQSEPDRERPSAIAGAPTFSHMCKVPGCCNLRGYSNGTCSQHANRGSGPLQEKGGLAPEPLQERNNRQYKYGTCIACGRPRVPYSALCAYHCNPHAFTESELVEQEEFLDSVGL